MRNLCLIACVCLCALVLCAAPAGAADIPLTLDGMSVVSGPYWEGHEPASLSIGARITIRGAEAAGASLMAAGMADFDLSQIVHKPLKQVGAVAQIAGGAVVSQAAFYATLKGVTTWPNSASTELALKLRVGAGFRFGGHGLYHAAILYKPAEAAKLQGKPGWQLGGVLWSN